MRICVRDAGCMSQTWCALMLLLGCQLLATGYYAQRRIHPPVRGIALIHDGNCCGVR